MHILINCLKYVRITETKYLIVKIIFKGTGSNVLVTKQRQGSKTKYKQIEAYL